MKETLKQKKSELEKHLQDTIKAMQNVKTQISILNKKGEELATHATYLGGKIDLIEEVLKNDDVLDIEEE